MDACEEGGSFFLKSKLVLPRSARALLAIPIWLEIIIEDNGPGLEAEELPKVFGEYLASSKFGRGQCSRGQQGIGISAATTWAQLTNATGVKVRSKTKRMRKAVEATVDVDIKGNKGMLKNKASVDWEKPHGLKVSFRIDGRVQFERRRWVIDLS